MMSESEWEVLRVIWTHQPVTSHFIIEVLTYKMGWAASTVKTLLRRLEEKKIVAVNKEKRPFQYTAILNERETVVERLENILSQTCCKQIGNDLYQLLSQQNLSIEQWANIAQLATEKQNTAKEQIECQCSYGQCPCQCCCHQKKD